MMSVCNINPAFKTLDILQNIFQIVFSSFFSLSYFLFAITCYSMSIFLAMCVEQEKNVDTTFNRKIILLSHKNHCWVNIFIHIHVGFLFLSMCIFLIEYVM